MNGIIILQPIFLSLRIVLLVVSRGNYSDVISNEGVCPVAGFEMAYCAGDNCIPQNQQCEDGDSPFLYDCHFIFTLCVTGSLIILFYHFFVLSKRMEHASSIGGVYPYDKVIFSVLPAFLILANTQLLFRLFYGTGNEYELDSEAIDEFLNPSVSSFLKVTGVLYSILVAQIFVMTQAKFKLIRDSIGQEVSALRRTVVSIRNVVIDEDDKSKRELQMRAVNHVVWYTSQVIKSWGVVTTQDTGDLDGLYSVLSFVGKLCNDSNNPFNTVLADRITGSLEEVCNCSYTRLSCEDLTLATPFWMMSYLLSTAMFLGVALINTGSYALQLTMCYLTTILIGTLAWIIADMDFVYVGIIKVTPGPFYDLLSVLTTPATTSKVEDGSKRGGVKKPRLHYTPSAQNLLATAQDYNRVKPSSKARHFFSTSMKTKGKVSSVGVAAVHPDDRKNHKGLMRLNTMDCRRRSVDEHSGQREIMNCTSPTTTERRALVSVDEEEGAGRTRSTLPSMNDGEEDMYDRILDI